MLLLSVHNRRRRSLAPAPHCAAACGIDNANVDISASSLHSARCRSREPMFVQLLLYSSSADGCAENSALENDGPNCGVRKTDRTGPSENLVEHDGYVFFSDPANYYFL